MAGKEREMGGERRGGVGERRGGVGEGGGMGEGREACRQRGVRMRRMGGKRMVVENKDTFTCTVILVHTYIRTYVHYFLFPFLAVCHRSIPPTDLLRAPMLQ